MKWYSKQKVPENEVTSYIEKSLKALHAAEHEFKHRSSIPSTVFHLSVAAIYASMALVQALLKIEKTVSKGK